MEFTGQVVNVSKDWNSNKFHITFSVNEDVAIINGYDKIKNLSRLLIKAVKYRTKRSLDANAYMWVLLQKMADVLETDKWNLYLQLLSHYGVFTHLIVKPHVVERVKAEWRSVVELGEVSVNGVSGIQLQCYFGSSTYNTKEMSTLIDGVVREAQGLGIETLPEDKIEEMKQRWGIEIRNST